MNPLKILGLDIIKHMHKYLAAINAHQAALADLLEAFEERVAIAEVCGGLPRAEAERLAWSCVLGEEAARGSIVEGVS